ncbi:MAG: flagellar biosynthetic protein FliO [Steroidobacteraceae bacterium]
MVKAITRLSTVASFFILHVVHAADAPKPGRFAAPEVAGSLPSGGASGIGQVTVALVLVLVAVFVVALLLKRLRAVTGAGANGIEVLGQASLGAKERAVIIRVGNERLLLGVAAGQVSLLQKLPLEITDSEPRTAATAAEQRPSFGALLRKSLGR